MTTPSTYKRLTAQNIMNKLKVKLSAADVESVLEHPKSFYRLLLRAPAHLVYNQFLLTKALELHELNQQELNELYFKRYTAAQTTEEAEAKSKVVGNTEKSMSKVRESLEEQNVELEQLRESQHVSEHKITDQSREMAQQFEQAMTEQIDAMTEQLAKRGYPINEITKARVLHAVLLQTPEQPLTEDQLREFGIKADPYGIYAAMFSILTQEFKP